MPNPATPATPNSGSNDNVAAQIQTLITETRQVNATATTAATAATTATTATTAAREAAETAVRAIQARLDIANTEATELRTQVVALQASHDQVRESVTSAGRNGLMGRAREAVRSFGEELRHQLFDDEGQLREQFRGRGTIKLRDLQMNVRMFSSGAGSAGALVPEHEDQGIVYPGQQTRTTILDRIAVIPVSTSLIKFVRRDSGLHLFTRLDGAHSTADTELTLAITDDSGGAGGITIGTKLLLSPGKAAEEEVTVGAVDLDANTVTVTALANNHLASAEVTSDQFVMTPAGYIKPNAEMSYNTDSVEVKTLALIFRLHRDIYDDASRLQGEIDMEVPISFRRQLESQVLLGEGGQTQHLGILNNPKVRVYKWSDGKVGDTMSIAVRRAAIMLAKGEYDQPDLAISPDDFGEIEIEDDKLRRPRVTNEGGQVRIWRIPTFETSTLPEGKALLGDFRACVRYLRMDLEVEIFEQDRDNVVKNLLTIRAELREAFAVKNTDAFMGIIFDEAPS